MKKKNRRQQQSKRTRRKKSPVPKLLHKRVRDASRFVKFRVVSKMSRLSKSDQSKVRSKVPKNRRAQAKYTVGKFKSNARGDRPKGKTGRPLAWGLQKITVPKKKRGYGVKKT